MDKSFFNLPESVKRAIWTALLVRWEARKKAAGRGTVQQPNSEKK